jgi:hypothetical protein
MEKNMSTGGKSTKHRNEDDRLEILKLYKIGKTKTQISKELNIPRSTVCGIINLFNSTGDIKSRKGNNGIADAASYLKSSPSMEESYSYVLGLYLGDGHINKSGHDLCTYSLKITQDAKYQKTLDYSIKHMKNILPNNKLSKLQRDNCIITTISSNHLRFS